MQRFLVIKYRRVLTLKPVWFHLQRIGIDLSFPEPLRTTELDVVRIDSGDLFQRFEQPSSQKTVLNTEGNVGNPVLHFSNGIFPRQGLKVMRVFLTVVDEMSIAALQCETIRQSVESVDEIDYGYVNHVIRKIAQTSLPLRLI